MSFYFVPDVTQRVDRVRDTVYGLVATTVHAYHSSPGDF